MRGVGDGLKPTRFELGDLVRRYRDVFPTIIIFPQAPPGHFWEELQMQQLVMAQPEAAEREFRTDAARVYLARISDARYTELPAAGHNDAAEAAYNLDVFRWLLAQSGPQPKP